VAVPLHLLWAIAPAPLVCSQVLIAPAMHAAAFISLDKKNRDIPQPPRRNRGMSLFSAAQIFSQLADFPTQRDCRRMLK
jgi:hypothetical protein